MQARQPSDTCAAVRSKPRDRVPTSHRARSPDCLPASLLRKARLAPDTALHTEDAEIHKNRELSWDGRTPAHEIPALPNVPKRRKPLAASANAHSTSATSR